MYCVKSTIFLLIFALLHSITTAGKTKEELIQELFRNNSSSTTTSTLKPPESRNPEPPTTEGGSGLPGVVSDCVCVPFYNCKNGSLNTAGENVIDIRINEGGCPSYMDICCKKDDRTEQPITRAPPVENNNKPKGCGQRNPQGVGFRITGDENDEAQFGEFPWMVAILREETIDGNPNKLNVYQCGGALIHPQVVLTAAHCVKEKKQFKVRAGEWDTQTKDEIFPHQDRQVSSIKIHEEFYAGALFNDVALLFLESPVELGNNIDVICLPAKSTNFDHSRCFASGWGKDVFGKEGKYQVILKKIELPMVPRDTCQKSLRATRLGQYFELHKSFVCAGGEQGKDTCKGDGGSPLVCPIQGQQDRYQQAGMVAWGIGCGEKNTPAVYVNVAMFRDWIDAQMSAKNFDTSAYQF